MLAGPAQALATQMRDPIKPICNDLINIDEYNIWFTNSYRKQEAKFRNNLRMRKKSSLGSRRLLSLPTVRGRDRANRVAAKKLEAFFKATSQVRALPVNSP